MNISCIPNLQDVRSSGPLTEHALDVRQVERLTTGYCCARAVGTGKQVCDECAAESSGYQAAMADEQPLTLTQRIRAALAWRPVLTWRDEFWGMAVLAVVVGWVGLLGYVLMTIGERA